MTVMERINNILDGNSFIEIGCLTGGSNNPVVAGYGTIDGRLVYIYGENYKIEGGLLDAKGLTKICRVMEMALKMGSPLIHIADSTGVKLADNLDILSGYGKMINLSARLSGVVPQITVVVGPCTGISAVCASMSDFTIITENVGELYLTSSSEIQEREGKYIANRAYSSYEYASKNGSIQISAGTDNEALSLVRSLVGYLPSNNIEFSPAVDAVISDRKLSDNKVIGDEHYQSDPWDVLNAIADSGSIIEVNKQLSQGVITVLARINGRVLGVIANQRNFGGDKLSIRTCEKVTRFVKICDCFNISIVTIVDCRGFIEDATEERNGLAVVGAKMMYALAEANVPKVALITGEAYGAGFIAFASKETAFDVTYSWPTARIGLTEPETAVKILYKEEITSSEKPISKERELIKVYSEESTAPIKAAEKGFVDDIIKPSETMHRLYSAIDMLQSKRIIKYPKKHGSTLI